MVERKNDQEKARESEREQERAKESERARQKKKERERQTEQQRERHTERKSTKQRARVCAGAISARYQGIKVSDSRYQGMRLNSRYQDIKVSDSTLHTATFLKEICHTHLGAVISSSRAREAVVAVSLGLNPQFELCAIVSGCIQ